MVTVKERTRKALKWLGHRFEAIIGVLLLITFIGMFSSIFGAIIGLVGYVLPVVIPVGIIAFAKWVSDLSWTQILSVIPKILLSNERNPNQSAVQSANKARDPTMASQQGRDNLTQNVIGGGKNREDLIEEEILTPILNGVENHIMSFERGFATTFDLFVFYDAKAKKNLYLKTKERPKIEAYYAVVEENNKQYLTFIKKANAVFKSVANSVSGEKKSLIERGQYVSAVESAIDQLCNDRGYNLIQAVETKPEESVEMIVEILDKVWQRKAWLTDSSDRSFLEKRKEIVTDALNALADEKETKELLEKRKQLLLQAKNLRTLLEKSLQG